MKIEDIEQWVIPGAGQQFTGDDFRSLREPGVYIFMREGKALYVGKATRLLGRIGARHHQAEAIYLCDQVLLYPCKSDSAALRLEELLITKLRPRFNAQKLNNSIKQRLGLARSSNHLFSRVSRARKTLAHNPSLHNVS